jgi:hypothetical protein
MSPVVRVNVIGSESRLAFGSLRNFVCMSDDRFTCRFLMNESTIARMVLGDGVVASVPINLLVLNGVFGSFCACFRF